MEAGWAWLAVIGVLNSAVSFGYYGNVIRKMYFEVPVAVASAAASGHRGAGRASAAAPAPGIGWALRVALGLSLGLTLLLGIVPRLLFGALG